MTVVLLNFFSIVYCFRLIVIAVQNLAKLRNIAGKTEQNRQINATKAGTRSGNRIAPQDLAHEETARNAGIPAAGTLRQTARRTRHAPFTAPAGVVTEMQLSARSADILSIIRPGKPSERATEKHHPERHPA